MGILALLPRPRVAFIPAGPYARAVDWLEGGGHDRAALLDSAGIDPLELKREDGLLTLDQIEALVRHLIEVVKPRGRGLEFGSSLHFPTHGAAGFAGLTAPNMAASTDVAGRFLELVTPLFVLERTEQGAHHLVTLAPRYRMNRHVLRVHLQVAIGSMLVLVRHGVGTMPTGTEVTLPVDDPEVLGWLASRGFDARTGGDVVTMRIPAELMSKPLPLADARAHAMAVAQCEALLANRRAEDQTIRDVRRLLRRAGPPFPDFPTVSHQLGASERTVRRRLDHEGTSFRELLEEARFDWAARALTESDRSVTHIAYELGYAAPGNFTRAFGRALGVTPRAFRLASRAGSLPQGALSSTTSQWPATHSARSPSKMGMQGGQSARGSQTSSA